MSLGSESAAWRDENAYRFVRQLDRAGFAWELLRRNPRYREQAASSEAVARSMDGYLQIEAAGGCGPRWGLCFCGAPWRTRYERPAILARRGR